MCQCPYQVCSGVSKSPSKAAELEEVFLGTITQPIGSTEKGAIWYGWGKPICPPGYLSQITLINAVAPLW